MPTHSSILPGKIPWTEEPGRLQFTGLKESNTTQAFSWDPLAPFDLECPLNTSLLVWTFLFPFKALERHPLSASTPTFTITVNLTLVIFLPAISHILIIAPKIFHYSYLFSFFLLIFWPCHMAHGILFPWPRTEPRPPPLETQSLMWLFANFFPLLGWEYFANPPPNSAHSSNSTNAGWTEFSSFIPQIFTNLIPCARNEIQGFSREQNTQKSLPSWR